MEGTTIGTRDGWRDYELGRGSRAEDDACPSVSRRQHFWSQLTACQRIVNRHELWKQMLDPVLLAPVIRGLFPPLALRSLGACLVVHDKSLVDMLAATQMKKMY